tara:strand:+ start:346 stop:555 length:210 start_codon:yes stop_codon:yes gene_type:complete
MMAKQTDKLRKELDKAIEWGRQNRIRRIEEDEATAEHDMHDDGYDIYPDPYCRECRIDFPDLLRVGNTT